MRPMKSKNQTAVPVAQAQGMMTCVLRFGDMWLALHKNSPKVV